MILTGGMMAKGFSLEIKRQVVDDYKSNRYTVHQVARKHGVSEAAVYKWVKEDSRGELAEPKETRALREGKLSREQVESIISEYMTGKVGSRRIASKYGITPAAVVYILKREGVYEGFNGECGRRSKLSKADIEEVIRRYSDTDENVQSIAEYFKVTSSYIRMILNENNVPSVKKKRKLAVSALKYSLKEQLVSDYKTGNFTHKELSKRHGVSSRWVSDILKSAGVEAIGGRKLSSATEIAAKRDEVLNLVESGQNMFDVADDTGMSVCTIKHILEQSKRSKSKPEENPLEQKVVELHSQGLIIKEIAEKAETSVYHVKRILEKLHLEPNSPSDKHRGAVIAFCKQGMSVDMIAEKTELSAPTVRKMLHEEGLSVSKGNGEVKAKVLGLYQQGLKAPKIALECGISAPTVRKIISEAQVTTEQKSTENVTAQSVEHLEKSGSCDIDVKIAELYDEGMDVEEIAQELGLSRPMVMFSLRKAMDSMKVYRPFFTDLEITEIKSLARQWVAPDAIANKLKCHENYVRRFLDLPDKGNVK